MSTFHLFRIRVQSPDQRELFPGTVPEEWFVASSAIEAALTQAPEYTAPHRGQWHIGGIENVGTRGLYFQLGRVTRALEPKWDDDRKAFVEEEDEDAPYTHALLDLSSQVVGLLPKREIAATPRSLGTKLATVLNSSEVAGLGFRFFVTELVNPAEFLLQLREAYAVRKFSFTTFRPNFPDEAELTKALEEYVKEVAGQEVKTEVKGPALDVDVVERQARESIAGGGKVTARVARAPGVKPTTIRPGKNPVTVEDLHVETADQREESLSEIVARYLDVSGHGEDLKER